MKKLITLCMVTRLLTTLFLITALLLLTSITFLSANDTYEPEKLVLVEIPEGDNDVYAYGVVPLENAVSDSLKIIKEVEPLEVRSPLTGEVIIEKCPTCGHEL